MATVARTKQDVDNMTKQDRLWDSLNHAYGQQRESSDKSFDRAYSQADRQALSRGMQRSSYNAQNLANINQQKIEAQNNIWNNQIADYENRLGALESEEAEAERWERQFEANRADVAWNQNFQQGQADLAAQQWEREFTRGTDSADRQLAASYVSAIVAQGGTPSDDLLARAGLSRADAEAMRKGGSGSGGSGGGPGPSNPGNDTPPGNPNGLFSDMPTLSDLAGNNGNAVLNWINKHPASAPAENSSAGQSLGIYNGSNTSGSIKNITRQISDVGIQSPDAYKDAFAEQLNAPPKSQTAEERFGSTTKRKKNYSNETWSAYH